ncbi:MAG: 23S rRNA (guanine745-N1)-methyltransferase [Candidatus Azotimanducaceae bacterium]|jgi:23S rRNA (guanine745-N1)-methyltransferase
MKSPLDLFICPVCNKGLVSNVSGMNCPDGHHFDKAKEGYLNLLGVSKKNSLSPGDSKSAVKARFEFLNAGFYQPIVEELNKHILAYSECTSPVILDAGCGEGYYLHHLKLMDQKRHCVGLDISKEAIKVGAKNRKNCQWIVASANSPPIKPCSVDIAIFCFSPYFEPCLELIKPGGIIIFINGGPKHLTEMRQKIYNDNRIHHFRPKVSGRASLVKEATHQYLIALNSPEQRQNLINMTPHQFRSTKEAQRKFVDSSCPVLNIDTLSFVYRKE